MSENILFKVEVDTRPIPFYDFALFVVLILFTDGSSNAGRIFSAYALGEPAVKRVRTTKFIKWDRPG